ncbi:unnamed protein product [Chironomus riparius]|uniref:Metalloendopeptidase n=1 Tax=Chironomus riparius TaxID=315576 RepID=A0A9N9WSN6_9DIPT|nr:unnamed protein product [Chironomus riparius]
MNSLEKCLILIILLKVLCLVESYPSNKIPCTKSDIGIKPCEASRKIILGMNRRGNPEERGPYFEGDIIRSRNKQLKKPPKLWINGIVPYEISGTFPPTNKKTLMTAIEEVNSKTCLNLIPRTNQKDFIIFKSDPSSCWSSIGRIGGPQVVNLESQCLKAVGTGIHEIFHSVGLYHEQNRIDRDDFVDIKTDNILNSKLVNFQKTAENVYNTNGVGYDYGSVMHYSPYSFSKNGKITIETKGNPNTKRIMGQRAGMSQNDIEKIKRMYNCQ